MSLRGKVSLATRRRLERALDRVPERVRSRMDPEFKRWGRTWQTRVKARIGGGGQLANRSHRLSDSINFIVDGTTAGSLRLRCYTSGVIYARIQELGGLVKPVNGRFLSIPLDAAKTSAGVARFSIRQFIDAHPGETFFVRHEDGSLVLVWNKPTAAPKLGSLGQKRRKGARPANRVGIAMFKLVRQVELPGPKAPTKVQPSRLGFFDEWHGLAADRRAGVGRVAASLGGVG